jgi:hypothetical protein
MRVNTRPDSSTSRKHLGRFIAAIGIVIAAHGLAGCGDRESSNGTAAPVPSVADSTSGNYANPAGSGVSPPASVEPPGTDDQPGPSAVAPASAAPGVAAGFAAAWVRSDLGAAQWLKGIVGFCEPGFAAKLASVDPANVPAHRVTGKPRAVRAPANRSAQYAIATDEGTLTVTLVDLNGRWRVSGNDYDPSPR